MSGSDLEITQETAELRRFVVCGDDSLAFRLADELANRHRGEVTVIMQSLASGYGRRIAQLDGVRAIEAERPADAYAAADIATADALALVERNDVANIDAALSAHDISPSLRTVIRMFNTSLAEGVAQLPYCTVLSDAAMAAPAFVAATLGGAVPIVQLRNDSMIVAHRAEVAEGDVLCGVAITQGRDEAELLPADQSAADLVLARSVPQPRPRRSPRLVHHYPVRAILGRIWRRLRVVLAVFVGLLIAGAAIVAVERHEVSWWEAAYMSIIVAFGGAQVDLNASTVEQVTVTVLTVLSIALIPLLTAAVVDAVVKARLDIAEKSLAKRASGHVVVVGLGGVGSHVVRALYDLGADLVAIDRSAAARGVPVVRDLRLPLIIGDASHRETLEAASVSTCRALMAITSDDVTNLETALTARAIRPDLRVVLRLFDGEFADRIQRAFDIPISRSVSYLAVPSFAAHMLGQTLDTIPIGRHVLLIANLTVGAYSTLEGQTVGNLRRPNEAWLLEIVNPLGQRLPPTVSGGRRLMRGDTLLVVATRGGLARLNAETSPLPEASRPALILHDTPPRPRRPRPSI